MHRVQLLGAVCDRPIHLKSEFPSKKLLAVIDEPQHFLHDGLALGELGLIELQKRILGVIDDSSSLLDGGLRALGNHFAR